MNVWKRLEEQIKNLKWNEKLRILRLLYGWTQKKAAKKCGVTQRVYWSWENGVNFPRQNGRWTLEDVFEIGAKDLWGRGGGEDERILLDD